MAAPVMSPALGKALRMSGADPVVYTGFRAIAGAVAAFIAQTVAAAQTAPVADPVHHAGARTAACHCRGLMMMRGDRDRGCKNRRNHHGGYNQIFHRSNFPHSRCVTVTVSL